MTDKNNHHDEEYQFPQEEYADERHAEQPLGAEEGDDTFSIKAEEPVMPSGIAAVWANHKRTIIILGVIVAVGVTFAIMRATHRPAPTPVAPPPVEAVVQPVVDPQVMVQLASLKQESMDNNATVRQLQGQVQQLTGTLNQTRAAQQQLNQSLMVLVSQVQQLSAEVRVLAQPKVVKVEKPVVKAKPVPVITFQLRAVVPGRAWIVGSDGQSHSVAVGDHVPQYGVVQHIDADAGIVTTSSGKAIKF